MSIPWIRENRIVGSIVVLFKFIAKTLNNLDLAFKLDNKIIFFKILGARGKVIDFSWVSFTSRWTFKV